METLEQMDKRQKKEARKELINPIYPVAKVNEMIWIREMPDSEVDPNGIKPGEPGSKLDSGKPMASLLQDFGKALLAVAEVGTFGAKKYSRGGWQEVPDGVNRYSDAMLRHYFKERYGEIDDDSGLSHAAHLAWNALARLEFKLREKEE